MRSEYALDDDKHEEANAAKKERNDNDPPTPWEQHFPPSLADANETSRSRMTVVTMASKSFTVFLVRHGERLDEALQRASLQVSRALKTDPPLTATGHQQAYEALSRLLLALEEEGTPRKIAVVTSPLRRTIGTCLMLAAAQQSVRARRDCGDSCLTFGFQPESNGSSSSSPLEDNAHGAGIEPIPILILNGIGSAAAMCQRYGSADALVTAGRVHCGDMEANDGSITSPLVKELQTMQEVYRDDLVWVDEDPEEEEDRTKTLPRVQFCKIQGGSGQVVPISPPLSAKEMDKVCFPALPPPPSQILPRSCQAEGLESFPDALDRAVRIADHEGCDTLIVTTHRESIYSLVQQWGLNGMAYHGHPYGCIGCFIATRLEGETHPEWSFEGVAPYQEFDALWIPDTRIHDILNTSVG